MKTKKSLTSTFSLETENDYVLAKNTLRILFGEKLESLIISKKKQIIGIIYEGFKITSNKLNSLVEKIFSYDGQDLDGFLKELKTKEIWGFNTELKF